MTGMQIEVLTKQDRKGFRCGNEVLDRYLIEHAGQDQRRQYAVCYLAIERETNAIIGYYTLSSSSVRLRDLPEDQTKKLPRYPVIPTVKVGRLAIAESHQGKGIGGALLADGNVGDRAQRQGVGGQPANGL